MTAGDVYKNPEQYLNCYFMLDRTKEGSTHPFYNSPFKLHHAYHEEFKNIETGTIRSLVRQRNLVIVTTLQ